MRCFLALALSLAGLAAASPQGKDRGKNDGEFETLQWLGANSPWYPGPDVYNLGDSAPSGCKVDQAIYIIRHGSRYPDPGAWNEWLALYNKTQSATFTGRGALAFLPEWKPVLQHPEDDIAQLSVTGYRELTTLGTTLRHRYPDFYAPNTPFTVWTNYVQRAVDSARLFSHGFAGPNATALVDIAVVDPTHPAALANSLAPSDLCPAYADDSSAATAAWDAVYLPPIRRRLQKLVSGNLTLTSADVGVFPYLCGFETQITGFRSPFCGIFTDEEIRQYEYRQDLRYWYGTGLGSGLEGTMMVPVLDAVVGLLNNSTAAAMPLVVAFTHDNQINQLVAASGVFDQHAALDPTRLMKNRTFISSRINPMRGTVAFERLSCVTGKKEKKEKYVRIRLNDAAYPVAGCDGGPGKSCPLESYAALVAAKVEAAGSFAARCNVTKGAEHEGQHQSFFTDKTLEWIEIRKP